jgi:hypothetical protein
VLFELQRHGIPSLGFPVADDGTLLTHLCREHWQKRRVLEESVRREKAQPPQTRTLVIRIQTPTQNDVLLGRGKAFYSHCGNIELRKIIMGTLSVYDAAPFAEKQHVSDVIVRMIHGKGGHFLKEDEAWWVEVDAETARKKVRWRSFLKSHPPGHLIVSTHNVHDGRRFHTCSDPSVESRNAEGGSYSVVLGWPFRVQRHLVVAAVFQRYLCCCSASADSRRIANATSRFVHSSYSTTFDNQTPLVSFLFIFLLPHIWLVDVFVIVPCCSCITVHFSRHSGESFPRE